MKLILIFLSLIALSSCKLIEEQELQSDIKSAEQYCDYLMSDSELDPIRNKLPLNDINKADFDMLANTQKATDAEKPVIRIYAMKETECQTKSMRALDKFGDESYITIANGYRGVVNGLIADLYNQQLSYGDFIRQAQKASTEVESALLNANAQRAAKHKPISCNTIGTYIYCY